eukprot:86584-Alexandrium_andersonii.AAC.1
MCIRDSLPSRPTQPAARMRSEGQPPAGGLVALQSGLRGRVHVERAGSPAAAGATADAFDLDDEMPEALDVWAA